MLTGYKCFVAANFPSNGATVDAVWEVFVTFDQNDHTYQ